MRTLLQSRGRPRGEEIYERDIRSKVEAEHRGTFLVIDIESGDYEIDHNALDATHRVAACHPGGGTCSGSDRQRPTMS